jgi:photosystem II stability/assembly factor-like uncharacterized protein
MKKITPILLLIFTTLSGFSQSWTPLTTGTTSNLLSVSFANDNTGWSVGMGGKIIKTINGGSSWTTQTSGISSDLYSVCAIDTNTAISVGNANTIIRTTDGGATWSIINAPANASLRAVWFLNSTIGFITGGSINSGIVFKTTNGGLTWTSLSISAIATYGVFFTDVNNGYVSDGAGTILKTTNGGTSWTNLNSGVSVLLDYIFFTDPNTGYASGEDGTIIKTTNAGADWEYLTIGTTDRFLSIIFLDPATGYASGGDVGGSNAGSIYKTMDAGVTWTLETTNVNRFYRGSFPSHAAGYVCGLNGTIVKITNINSGMGVSENNLTHFNFNLYPNPFVNEFSANINLQKEESLQSKIIDVLGRECFSKNYENLSTGDHLLQFDNITLPAGTYFVQIRIGSTVETKMLIKTE